MRLHQEDFRQALGFLPEQKYESEGGPALAQCFDLLQENSIRPAADRLVLLRWTIFKFLIGNAAPMNYAFIVPPLFPMETLLIYHHFIESMLICHTTYFANVC